MLIDVHAHLCDDAFNNDLPDVLKRAKQVGIERVIAVGETLEDVKANLKLAKVHEEVLPAGGLYPTILDINQAGAVSKFIEEHCDDFVAIGEVGLDYWKVKEEPEREIQREIFATFINLSNRLELPLNVHSRSAGRHAIEFLLKHNAKKVIMHAFDGKATSALPAVEAGYYFSIPPSIVRSQQKRKLVKRLPLSYLLLETDSPVLGPDKDIRNEPANALISLSEIAEIKNADIEEVRSAIEENQKRLFGDIPGVPSEPVPD